MCLHSAITAHKQGHNERNDLSSVSSIEADIVRNKATDSEDWAGNSFTPSANSVIADSRVERIKTRL